jgi:hypothetical protein
MRSEITLCVAAFFAVPVSTHVMLSPRVAAGRAPIDEWMHAVEGQRT